MMKRSLKRRLYGLSLACMAVMSGCGTQHNDRVIPPASPSVVNDMSGSTLVIMELHSKLNTTWRLATLSEDGRKINYGGFFAEKASYAIPADVSDGFVAVKLTSHEGNILKLIKRQIPGGGYRETPVDDGQGGTFTALSWDDYLEETVCDESTPAISARAGEVIYAYNAEKRHSDYSAYHQEAVREFMQKNFPQLIGEMQPRAFVWEDATCQKSP
ncbi:hypothetical protein [Rahnella aceris]